MIDFFENDFLPILKGDNDILLESKVGLEKESFRIAGTKISNISHQEVLGSSLYHPHITTDFSESQIEFITPPFPHNIEVITFLEDLHNYVSNNIESEYLWPLSFPPNISNEDEIRIANYGNSNLAHLKTLYRKGLAFRYGKLMQSISGIHFNFSFSDKFWNHDIFSEKDNNEKNLKSCLYFKMIRNLQRMNWLIIYLYGASPFIPKSFMKSIDVDHTKRGNDYYFPYATSLRMSSLGYRNLLQSKLAVSTNSLEEYIKDLSRLLQQPSQSYQDGIADFSRNAQQINSNIIQIEAEYYASFRPKSKDTVPRPILSLKKNGVDYIEVRSLDVNPFSRIGIRQEDMDLMEIILVYSALSSSPKIMAQEEKLNKENSMFVSTEGRKPGLKINYQNKRKEMKDCALELLDQMIPIASSMNKEYALEKAVEKVLNPEMTPSGMLIEKFLSDTKSIDELGLELSQRNKKYYYQNKLSKEKDKFLTDLASKSLLTQGKNEKAESESFHSFCRNYLEI